MSGDESIKFVSSLGISDLASKLEKYLARRDEADRILPKARVVEIVYLGVVTNYSLFRTEGTSTIDTVELPGKSVTTPVIMPQKIIAIARRRLTELLRSYVNIEDKKYVRDKIVCRALELGYTKALYHLGVTPPKDYPKIVGIEKSGDGKFKATFRKSRGPGTKTLEIRCSEYTPSWDCWIQPPLEQGTDLGMDTYCPACVLFGAVLTADENVNMMSSGGSLNIGIKSRVAVDPAFSLYPRYEFKTHQKVAEGVLSNTGMSLYKEPHMVPASLVVGKIALYDVTEAEFLAVLLSMVSAKRYGGRQSRFGGLDIYPVAISAGMYERVSALELAEALVSDTKVPLGKAIDGVLDNLGNKFTKIVEKDKEYEHVMRAKLLEHLDNEDKFKSLFRELWEDALSFDEALVKRVEWLKKQ